MTQGETEVAAAKRIVIGGFIVFVALMLWSGAPAQAQDTRPVWGAPFNVSDSRDASVNPAITCDLFGNVHVFWSEKTQGEPREDPGHDVGDSIFYRQLQNGEWSQATDVAFVGQSDSFFIQPAAAADSAGMLHLVWSGYRGLYFSSAPIASATTAAAWSSPDWMVRINPTAGFSGPVKRPRLIVDEAHGSLHVIYSLYGTNGNLYYLRSPDMGQSWDDPRALTDVPEARSSTEVNANGRIILDEAGNPHVVWDYLTKEGEEWHTRAVRHQTSTDNGETWSTPTDVAIPEPGDTWWGSPDVVASAGKLHVVFVCGDRPRRCYTYSQDGGQTWAQPQRLFGSYDSIAGWDSLTVDSNGKVHLIAQLRDLNSETYIWHATWGPEGWPGEPSRIPYDPALGDHFPESCISLGNELHFVLDHESQGEVWHMSGQLNLTGAPALALPVPVERKRAATPTPVVVVAAAATELPAASQDPKLPDSAPPARRGVSESAVIIIGILPALLLVAGVILYNRLRTK